MMGFRYPASKSWKNVAGSMYIVTDLGENLN